MTFLPVCELQEGMIVEAKMGMSPYLVVKIENGRVTFQNEKETFEDDNGYVKVINKMQKVIFVRNLESGIIHATINGRALCSVRHSQDAVTTDHFTTCEKCIKLFEK